MSKGNFDFIGKLLTYSMWGSASIFLLNILTSVIFFFYLWSDGVSLSLSLWTSFCLLISVGFFSGVMFLMTIISMKALSRATSKYSIKNVRI